MSGTQFETVLRVRPDGTATRSIAELCKPVLLAEIHSFCKQLSKSALLRSFASRTETLRFFCQML